MEKLKKAEAGLSRIGDVRIIYLPPSAVAAAHYVGDEPEIHVNEMLDRFVRETGLHRRKPDLRHYGFNHPNPTDATGFHGYESWVTIPEEHLNYISHVELANTEPEEFQLDLLVPVRERKI